MNQSHIICGATAFRFLASVAIFLVGSCVAQTIAFAAPWLVEEDPCVQAGDIPVCEAAFSSSEWGAIANVHVIADQDSPLIGQRSSGRRHIQFQRSFSTQDLSAVTVCVNWSGMLRVEAGSGEARAKASIRVLDALTLLPMADSAGKIAALQFSNSHSDPGILELDASESCDLVVQAGTYILVCDLEVSSTMAVGWHNHESEVNGSLEIALSINTLQASAEQTDASFDREPDLITIPLGIEGTSYAHLESGVRGGTLTVATIHEPKSWNAVTAQDQETLRYTNIMMQGLLDRDPQTGLLVPELARWWEISEDGTILTLFLRRGLQWSDGEPFTADDVLFTFNDLYFNPDVETAIRDSFRLPDGTFPTFEKLDDATIIIACSMPHRPILDALCANIMPKHVLASAVHKLNPAVPAGNFNSTWTLETNPADIVGMGPFILADFSRGQAVTLKRNPYYYHFDPNGTRLPYVDSYVVKQFVDLRFALLDFRSHLVDAFVPSNDDVLALQRAAAANDFTVIVDTEDPLLTTSWICINQDVGLPQGTDESLRTLFRDVRFRRAVAHAIDKPSIIANAYNGMAIPQWSPVPIGSPYYAGRDTFGGPITEQDAVMVGFDLDESRRLLDIIGIIDRTGDGWRDFADGTSVEILLNTATSVEAADFRTPVRDAIGAIITEDLRAIGLHVTFQSLHLNDLIQQLRAGTFEMALLGMDSPLDPNGQIQLYHSAGDMHYWHASAAQDEAFATERLIDGWLSEGARTFDQNAAFFAYKAFQITFARDDLGLIFVANPSFVYAYANPMGNMQVANSIANPSGINGLTMDLVFRKSQYLL